MEEENIERGEVHELREENPEIGEIHLEESQNSGNSENGRQRTESTNSASSESWQHDDDMMKNMRRAQGLYEQGVPPIQIIGRVFPEFDTSRISKLSERAHLQILSDLLERAPSRQKLPNFNSLHDAVELFKNRKNILILTGAGVSVSCGIPDFRSKDGIYARLRTEFPDLPDPTAMFDIRYFRDNPTPFYNFAREIFPGQFTPSVSHRFIKELEASGRLLRNYTQNIDTLEHQTGIKRVVECHGSFSKCTCMECKFQYDGDHIRHEVLSMRVPKCLKCDGVIKPNIVFFGEDLGKEFHRKMTEDKNKVDLIVVIGSSLKVRPVALIPQCVGKEVPQILINRESLPHYNPDIELLGNCDDIIRDICFALGGQFESMIRDYDVLIGKDSQGSQSKRLLMSQEEFVENFILKKPSQEEPSTKRPRLDSFHEIQKMRTSEDEDTRNSDDVLRSIRHPRLIDVSEIIENEENKCVQVSHYQTVFPGAECSFDLETMKLVRDVAHRSRQSSSSSDDSEGSDDTAGEPLSRSQSTDDVVYAEARKSNPSEEVPIRRAESCESDLQYELSETIDRQTFSDLCDELRNNLF